MPHCSARCLRTPLKACTVVMADRSRPRLQLTMKDVNQGPHDFPAVPPAGGDETLVRLKILFLSRKRSACGKERCGPIAISTGVRAVQSPDSRTASPSRYNGFFQIQNSRLEEAVLSNGVCGLKSFKAVPA